MKRLSILAAIVIAILVTTSVFSATAVFAQTPTPTPTATPTPTPTPNVGAGKYRFLLRCGTSSTQVTELRYTSNGTVNRDQMVTLICTSAQIGDTWDIPVAAFNDLTVYYKCPPSNLTDTLYIQPGQLQVGKRYTLLCPTTGNTPTPGPTPTAGPVPTPRSGDATIEIVGPVGGIAEASDADASALEATASGGSSGTTYAVIAGIVAGALMLGAGGWYARRRWLS